MKTILLCLFIYSGTNSLSQMLLKETLNLVRLHPIYPEVQSPVRHVFISTTGHFSSMRNFAEIKFLENHTYLYRSGLVHKQSIDTLIYEFYTGIWYEENDSVVKLLHYNRLLNKVLTETFESDLILNLKWMHSIQDNKSNVVFRRKFRKGSSLVSDLLKYSPILMIPKFPCMEIEKYLLPTF